MILYLLLVAMTSVSCGLTLFLVSLSFRLAVGNAGFGRLVEGSHALIGCGWVIISGTLLEMYTTSPPGHAPFTPFAPVTASYLIGLTVSTIGLVACLRPTVMRAIRMEASGSDDREWLEDLFESE